MKTLRELAKEIQENPDNSMELLTSFRTTSREVREFLFSLQSLPVYLVPALIETFNLKHRENLPQKVSDLMGDQKFLGNLFYLSEDESLWRYVGESITGKPQGQPANTTLVLDLDPEKEIRFVC